MDSNQGVFRSPGCLQFQARNGGVTRTIERRRYSVATFFLLSRWLCNLDYEVRGHNWVIDWILSFTLAFKRWKIRNDVVYDIVNNYYYVSCQVLFIFKISLFEGVKHNVVLPCLSVLCLSLRLSLSLHPSIFLSFSFFRFFVSSVHFFF